MRYENKKFQDLSQPPPFAMASKLWKLYGKAKSYCIAVGCITGSLFNYLQQFHCDPVSLDALRIKYNTKTLVCKRM